jgi:hypothetical protein
LLFDDPAFALDFGSLSSAGRGELARLHQLADIRLQELVAALQFLMLVLDDLYTIDDVHEAGL